MADIIRYLDGYSGITTPRHRVLRNVSPGSAGPISGTATDDNGNPLKQADVILQTAAGGRVAAARTANDGTFAFHDLSSETYEIVLLGNGVFRSKVFGPFSI